MDHGGAHPGQRVAEFYRTYPSNTETLVHGSANTPAHFTIELKEPLELPEITGARWKVALVSLCLPHQAYNIYEPFNRQVLEIRRAGFERLTYADFEEVPGLPEYSQLLANSTLVQSIDLVPGLYDAKSFAKSVNKIALEAVRESAKEGSNGAASLPPASG